MCLCLRRHGRKRTKSGVVAYACDYNQMNVVYVMYARLFYVILHIWIVSLFSIVPDGFIFFVHILILSSAIKKTPRQTIR